ncbi:EpsG family protein [Pseudoalteromonas sp. Angola-30]|uniref:EpsG family protein n=1 Tax=Pseudoalteromonas sp. Angola-30 TaxID=3025341 RepID=UPI00235A13AA|nr:EpsG family protein [Pseudoalteromonas sp. Angola-30]MDC9524617.1 EpsG family protein [Pseudoalteromonas sp. Angola-30]
MTSIEKQLIKYRNTKLIYSLAVLALAFLYALVLSNYIPMDVTIKDRLNYIEYASNPEIIFVRYWSSGVISSFFNEPVWLGLNFIFSRFLTPEQVVATIIFFSAFSSAFVILKINPRYIFFLVFILLFPQVITKYVVHIRQGFAISLFLLGWFCQSRSWRWFFFALTPLIHASFFFILFLYVFTHILRDVKLSSDIRTIAVILFGLTIGVGLGFLAGAVGARQANVYEFSASSVSGLGFVLWLCVFTLYYLQGRTFAKKNAFAMSIIAFYLSTYFLIEVTGRIFESSVVIVLLASLGLTSWRRLCFFGLIISFTLITWILRFKEPWLGWGTGL